MSGNHTHLFSYQRLTQHGLEQHEWQSHECRLWNRPINLFSIISPYSIMLTLPSHSQACKEQPSDSFVSGCIFMWPITDTNIVSFSPIPSTGGEIHYSLVWYITPPPTTYTHPLWMGLKHCNIAVRVNTSEPQPLYSISGLSGIRATPLWQLFKMLPAKVNYCWIFHNVEIIYILILAGLNALQMTGS